MNALYRLHAKLLQKHSFAIVVVFGVLLPLIIFGAFKAVVSNTNDVTDWLPDAYTETRDLRWYQQNFHAGSDRIVIVSWDGCTLTDQRLELYADKLRNSKVVGNVLTGRELVTQVAETLQSADKELSTAQAEVMAIQRLEGTLIGPEYIHGMQLTADSQGRALVSNVGYDSKAEQAGVRAGDVITRVNSTSTPTLPEAVAALNATYDAAAAEQAVADAAAAALAASQAHPEVADPDQPDETPATPLPTVLKHSISLFTAGREVPYRWQWTGAKPARQTAILVTLSTDGRDARKLEAAIMEIRRIGEQECAISGPDKRIRMGGPAVDNVAIDQEGKKTLGIVATLSFVVGLGMCWLCFRDWKTTFLVFLVSLFSEATSLAIVFYSGSSVNAILLSMPTLIYVLTISGAIHIVNYYRDSIADTGVADAAHRAVRKGLVPSFLSAITTAMGMGSLLIADLRPIRLFGGFSAIAVVSTLMWLFLLLPAVLHLSPPSTRNLRKLKVRLRRKSTTDRFWTAVGHGIVARSTTIFALSCVVLFGVGAGIYKLKSNISLMKLFDDDAQIIHDYTWLESRLGPLVPMEVVVSFDKASFDGGATAEGKKISPMDPARRLRIVDMIRKAIEDMPEVGNTMSALTFVPTIPTGDGPSSAGFIRRVNTSLETGGGLANLEEAGWIAENGDEQMFRISVRLGAFSGIDYGAFVANIRRAVSEGALNAGIKTQLDTYVTKGALVNADGLKVTYTGIVPIVYKSQAELMRGLKESYIGAFIMIAGMMVLLVWPLAGPWKALPGGLLCMIPNIIPTAIVFGGLAWLNHPVDIGSMMTASIALGIAVDDTVHFLSWFRRGMDRGLNRREAVYDAYSHCARAMTQTTLVAGCGIAMHIFSTFMPTMMFGVLMLPLMATALVGDLVTLPALLCSPLGWFICRNRIPHKDGTSEGDGDSGGEPEIVPAPAFSVHRDRPLRIDRRFGT